MASDWMTQFPDQSIVGSYVDLTTKLAVDRAMVLDFYHVPTGYSVAFKAMINAFSDQYTSEWNTEVVYGRMDPIAMFQGTARTISVEWDVVAASVDEAKLNMSKCEMLMAMLYPTYVAEGATDSSDANRKTSANQISSSPLFKFKFGNFAQDATKGPDAAGARAKSAGLTGFIGGFTFEPDFESGIIDCPDGDPGIFYPQRLTLSAEFTVLHTHDMGWAENGNVPNWAEQTGQSSPMGTGAEGFPYRTKGSHQSGWERGAGRSADGASGTRIKTPEAKATEGTDPADEQGAIQGFALGLI